MKIAIVRGAFFNNYEAQLFYPLLHTDDLVAFTSNNPIHNDSPIKIKKLLSPMDIPFGPFGRFKMPLLNRIFIDAHYLLGLETSLTGFDIAHCSDTFYHFNQQCINAKINKQVKALVATVFENIPYNNEGIFGRKCFKHNSIKHIDKFLTATEAAKTALILEGCDPSKIIVFPSFIDTKIFHPRHHIVSSKVINILFSGRIEYYKGIYDYVYSAKKLILDPELKNYTIKFQVVGNGSEKKKIIQLVTDLGLKDKFKFMNVDYDKMPEVYQNADIFVAPARPIKTYQEQFCTVLLEAQSSGLPIVTTWCGGIPENVQNAALLSCPGGVFSISENVKRFILNKNLRQKFSIAARNQAVSKYDIKLGATMLRKIYSDILSSHN